MLVKQTFIFSTIIFYKMKVVLGSIIANRYFNLCIEYAEGIHGIGKQQKERLRMRIKNLYQIVCRLFDDGKITANKNKTKKSAWIDTETGEFK